MAIHLLHRLLLVASIIVGLAGCGAGDQEATTATDAVDSTTAAENIAHIDTERLSAVVKVLASDEFEGRAPGTPGGRKTVKYLTEQFAVLGLEPVGRNGSWTYTVPLIRTQVQTPAMMSFNVGGTTQTLAQQTDIAADTVRPIQSIAINAPVVFVGFGAYAPERDWDDYGDIDLRGKVALYLVNDPDFAAAPDEVVARRRGHESSHCGRFRSRRVARSRTQSGIQGVRA